MPYFGTILVSLGVLVIAVPKFISYVIGTVLIFAGANLILLALAVKKTDSEGKKDKGIHF